MGFIISGAIVAAFTAFGIWWKKKKNLPTDKF
jgi:hypothetical protein